MNFRERRPYWVALTEASCFLYELQLLRVTLSTLAVIIAVSFDDNGKHGKGSLPDILYQLDFQIVSTEYASAASSRSDSWHQRLAHGQESPLKKCVHSQFVQGLTLRKPDLSFCEDSW